MSWLSDMPLAGVKDLVSLGEFDVTECQWIMNRLRKSSDVRSVYLGGTLDMADRFSLTGRGVSTLFGHDYGQVPWASTARGIRALPDKVEFLEQAYRLVPSLLDPGRVNVPDSGRLGLTDWGLTGFEWLPSGIPHAITRYGDRVSVGLVWVGLQVTTPLLSTWWEQRFRPLGPALGERGRDHGRLPSTSGWLVIATDEWGKEVAQRHFGPADPTVKVVTAGENVTGEWPLIPTSNVVQVRPGPFAVGHVDSAIASLVAGRAASGFRGTSSSKVFMWVEQWYDTTKSRMAAALGLRSSDVDPIIDGFVENGFMSRYGRNIRVSAAGWKRSARRDRVHLSTIRERWQFLSDPDDVHRARNRHHQQGLIILAETCIRYQLPVAAGWRSVMNIPGVTQIHPDAMVLVGDGPLGAGWYCLEYERSATTPKRIGEKIDPYRKAAQNGQTRPLLIVCRSRRIEKLFWDAGRLETEERLPMVTTTYAEAREGPLAGMDTVWRHYGEPVSLYGPYGGDRS